MADKQISELTAAGTLDGTEIVHIVQSGNSRKVTLDDVVALAPAPADGITRGQAVAIASSNFMN
jgi:hypothetical protein